MGGPTRPLYPLSTLPPPKWCCLRRAATLNRPLEHWHITTILPLYVCIPPPRILKRVQRHLHHSLQNLPLALILHAVDNVVQDPASGNEIGVYASHGSFSLFSRRG